MEMSSVRAAPGSANHGFFDREATIAKAGFNRWLVPPAALAIHLCIGMTPLTESDRLTDKVTRGGKGASLTT